MDIIILTGIQKQHISGKKSLYNLQKKCTFEALFPTWRSLVHWYGNSLFYILTIYRKCILFQLSCCDICVRILTLKGIQKRHISG